MPEEITALVKLDVQSDRQVIAFYNEAIRLQEYADSRVITTAEDLKPATDDLSIIAKIKKGLEEKRKEYIKPLQNYMKEINEAFKIWMQPIEYADQVTRSKILAFQLKQKLIREEQEKINALRIEAAEAEMKLKGEITESVNLIEVIPEAPKRTATDMGTTSTFKVRKWEIIDFALLPDRFKMENATLIGKVVRAGEREIPGIRIWEEDSLRVNTK